MNDKVDDVMILQVRNVPIEVIKGIDVLAATSLTKRSEYVRNLLANHVNQELSDDFLKRIRK